MAESLNPYPDVNSALSFPAGAAPARSLPTVSDVPGCSRSTNRPSAHLRHSSPAVHARYPQKNGLCFCRVTQGIGDFEISLS